MKSKRIKLAVAIILVVSVSIALLASLSKDQIIYFYTVDEVFQKPQDFENKKIRVMGLVEQGTVNWNPETTKLNFFITETGKNKLEVTFTGIKPDLFREGQGAVVEGLMKQDVFEANTLLVKHSEEYKVIDHDSKKVNYLKSLNSKK